MEVTLFCVKSWIFKGIVVIECEKYTLKTYFKCKKHTICSLKMSQFILNY